MERKNFPSFVYAETSCLVSQTSNHEYMEVILDGKTLAELFAEINKDLVLEAVIKDKELEVKMALAMRKVLREPDFSLELLAV